MNLRSKFILFDMKMNWSLLKLVKTNSVLCLKGRQWKQYTYHDRVMRNTL